MEAEALIQIKAWMASIGLDIWVWPWTWLVGLVLTLTAITASVVRLLLGVIVHHAMNTESHIDDVLLNACGKPIIVFVCIFGINLSVHIMADAGVLTALEENVQSFSELGYVLLTAWAFFRIVDQFGVLFSQSAQKGKLDRSTILFFSRLAKGFIVAGFGIMLMSQLGFDVSGLLALGGVGGLVIGMAARDSIANFFGGLMVHIEKPFREGDWIRSPDREIEGTVEEIGWRMTSIRTFDQRPLYVPNSVFNEISIENPSRMRNRRIYETVGVRYSDSRQVADITREVRDYCRSHPELDMTRTLIVNFTKFNDSSLDFFVYTFTRTTDWVAYHQIKESVMLGVLDIIHSHGADVAFPTRTLQIENPEAIPDQ